jgi:hypothetical protein
MYTTEPPLTCEHCGELVSPSDEYTAITREDRETGAPEGFTGGVVHTACWPAYAAAQGIKAD